jgi:transcriptional regulator with AAA-type ATPase domain
VLERCHGNKREACRVLDISYHTLQSYLRFPWQEDGAASPPALDSSVVEESAV